MQRNKTYRQRIAPKIHGIILANKGATKKELKVILRQNKPLSYAYHKKVWANESMRQLGLSKKKKHRVELYNQLELF
jgi:hypothetical protein